MENHLCLGFDELAEVVRGHRAIMNTGHGCALLHMN